MQAMENSNDSTDRRCYGVDLADDGTLFVAERVNKTPGTTVRYPAGAAGVSALRERLINDAVRPSVCIRSCGAAAMAIAMSLATLPVGEVTLIASRAVQTSRSGHDTTSENPEERAQRLAYLAERLP